MTSKVFKTYTYALTAGVEHSVTVAGDGYSLIQAASPITIRFNDTEAFEQQSTGMGAKFERSYQKVTFISTVTQTIVVVLGFGEFKDTRSNVNATINTTIAPADTINNPGDVVAGVAPVLAIAANANRKEVELCLPSTATNPVRIGNAGVTASSGSILEPGMSKVFACEAELYVIRTVTDETVTVLELERP